MTKLTPIERINFFIERGDSIAMIFSGSIHTDNVEHVEYFLTHADEYEEVSLEDVDFYLMDAATVGSTELAKHLILNWNADPSKLLRSKHDGSLYKSSVLMDYLVENIRQFEIWLDAYMFSKKLNTELSLSNSETKQPKM